jgi:low temperature requirement protein LtrA
MTSHQDQQQDNSYDQRSQGNLELFFDLVFVYAMSQVSELVLTDPTWRGLAHAVLALLAVWWAWVGYTWLTNTFETRSAAHQATFIAAMAAMLVAASALPNAFGAGALVFGVALLVVRLIHAAKFLALSSHDSGDMRTAVRRIVPAFVAAPALIVVAAFVHPPARELLWILAACIDYGAPMIHGMAGFPVAPRYFVQRHGSIVIIALGEVIAQLGAAGTQEVYRPAVILSLVLGVLIAATLWWTYFGLTTGAVRRLAQAWGTERANLARDAYSYLHLLPVAGTIAFAVGARASIDRFDGPLPPVPALALTGGVALFYLGDVAYRWRDHHQLTVDRLIAGLTCLTVFPAALAEPAILTMVVLTVIGLVRLGWELWRHPRVGPSIAGQVR